MMATKKVVKRKIIKIDEEKCDGCGYCVPGCPEGAIQVVNGKAKLVNEPGCDGLGACIGHCPRGAITIEEREAPAYDEISIITELLKTGDIDKLIRHIEHLKKENEVEHLRLAREFLLKVKHPLADRSSTESQSRRSVCQGLMAFKFKAPDGSLSKSDSPSSRTSRSSQLRNWPIQLHLINPLSNHYRKSNLAVVADCVPFAMACFHEDYLCGKTLAIACPKLDREQETYLDKLKVLIQESQVDTITVMIMEVPCCSGLMRIVQQAVRQSNRHVPVKLVVVGIRGEVLKEELITS